LLLFLTRNADSALFPHTYEKREFYQFISSIDHLEQSLWASMHGLCALLLARPDFPWGEIAPLIDIPYRNHFGSLSERALARLERVRGPRHATAGLFF
jgi:hypothetical protein